MYAPSLITTIQLQTTPIFLLNETQAQELKKGHELPVAIYFFEIQHSDSSTLYYPPLKSTTRKNLCLIKTKKTMKPLIQPLI